MLANKLNKIIIAEIGSVHDGSFGNAKELIKTASQCGADCVKFQTHIADAESLPDAPNPDYFNDESRVDYFNRTSFSTNQWKELKKVAEDNDLMFLSSPFSLEAVDILEEINIFGYKIPSGEVTNLPLLEKIATLRKPVFLSSGMSDWKELDNAYDILKDTDLTILQCSSIYPCPPENTGINLINEMKMRYKCRIGFSDHSDGCAASISAAALGATVIEKHFTFSKNMYGSDARHSMEPDEFSLFCKEIKNAWKILENPINKNDTRLYKEMKNIFQKSIVAACDIPKSTTINMQHLAFKKPGDGIPASVYKEIVGHKTVRKIQKNHKFNFKDIS